MVVGDFSLRGKVVVITGGGSGICLAFARLALEASAHVLIADLTLQPSSQDLVDSSSDHVHFMRCDVSDWKDLTRIPAAVIDAFGAGVVADVWVAGAGVFEPPWSAFLQDSEETEYKQLQINVAHPIKLSRIAMRSLLGANKPGVVLIVASMAGVVGSYGAQIYCASKHACVGFTKSMSQADEDENVKIVCVCPGVVKTPLWTRDEVKEQAAQFGYSDEIAVSAEEVAEAMVEMVQESQYAGGSILEVSKARLRGVLESAQSKLGEGPGAKAWKDNCYAPIREQYRRERGS